MWARHFAVRPTASPPAKTRIDWSRGIRQLHRWLAIAFTLTVIANFAAMSHGTPPPWITYSPLVPLFFSMFTGLYMFVLPYAAKRRRDR